MPDVKFKTLDEVPEGLKEHVKQVEGSFVVNVVPKVKLDEFRETNISLAQERDTLKTKVQGLSEIVGEDPDTFKTELEELRQTNQLVKDGKLKGSDAVENAVKERLENVKSSYESQLGELGKKLEAANQRGNDFENRFKRSQIDREITNAVLAKDSGVNPQALPDILTRAYGVYKVKDDGSLVAMKGDAVIYGSDGATPMSPKEWLTKLLVEAPYLGLSSNGGGAFGDRGDVIAGMSTEEFNKLDPATRIAKYREAKR